MSLRKVVIATALALAVSVAAPSKASADWLFTPYIGWNWGGTAGFTDQIGDFTDQFERQVNYGASLAWMGAGALGFELDFGYSPNFFANTTDDFQWGDSNVLTMMANLKVGAPFGGQTGAGVRPYASGGIGLIRTRINDAEQLFNVSTNDLGVNVGAGVAGFFSDHIGLRGDVRYFRSLQDRAPAGELDLGFADFRFWRGTVGLMFRF